MIIKHLPIKNPKKESLKHLIDYQEHGRDGLKKEERVLFYGTGNCMSDEPRNAEFEIRMVAKSNQRVKKSEKLAHLVLSLAPGEHLTKEQWLESARAVLKKLRMSDHQYFWYVHQDADQEHMHLVVNRINPKTRIWNTMSHDYHKLMELADDLEKRFSIQEIDHGRKNTKNERQAKDFERKSGQESLFTYVKGFQDDLMKATSWLELHELAYKHGIRLIKSGRGLAFTAIDNDKQFYIKASAIDRSLSLFNLEKRFGMFQEYGDVLFQHTKVESQYHADPKGYGYEQEQVNQIFARYRELQRQARIQRITETAQEDARYEAAKKQLNDTIRKAQKNAYFEFKNDQDRLLTEKQQLNLLKEKQLKKLSFEHKKKIADIRKKYKTMSFQDFLRKSEIDEDLCRDILRSRAGAGEQDDLNKIWSSAHIEVETVHELKFFSFIKRTTKGTDLFTSALSRGDTIRDDGFKLVVNKKPSLLTVADVLTLAKKRYGDDMPLLIDGTKNFQRQCAMIAAQENINISLSDPNAQNYFESLKEDLYARREQSNLRADQFARRNLERGEFIFGGSIRTIHRRRTVFSRRDSVYGHGRDQISGTRKTQSGQKRQAAATGGDVSEMSMGTMDRNDTRRKVLVQESQQFQLDGNGQEQLSGKLRRKVSGASSEGGVKDPFVITKAMQKYIDERQRKRDFGIKDILEHRPLTINDVGEFEYIGTRKLSDNHAYLLLKKGEMVYILKYDSNYELKRLKHLGKGTKVMVTKTGKVSYLKQEQTQGRHR